MIKNRRGETNKSNSGQLMTIIEYRKYSDLDVQFADGTIIRHKNYTAFKNGSIRNPNEPRHWENNTKIKRKRTGEESTHTQTGLKMKIIAYHRYGNIDIEFEDGTIVKGASYGNFQKGVVRYPKEKRKIGETNKAKNGLMMTIIKYRTAQDLDIQFEDGTIVEHRTYRRFKEGYIKHPNLTAKVVEPASRLGEKGVDREGNPTEIVGYTGTLDVIVKLSDGKQVRTTYSNFKNGTVPRFNRDTQADKRVGEVGHAACGEQMTIIEYNRASDITVQFEDGTIVKHKQYNNFKKGMIGKQTRAPRSNKARRKRNETVNRDTGE